MKEQKIREKCIELAKKLKGKQIYMMLSDERQYDKINDILLTILLKEQKFKCIYVSLNKGYRMLQKRMGSLGIDDSKIFFIDGISRTTGKVVETDNCTFLSSPQSLTELSLAITTTVEMGTFDFLFFDSLSTLLIYNKLKTIEKFSHYIISKIRNNNLGCIIISLKRDKEVEKLIPCLSQFCDGCIDVSGE